MMENNNELYLKHHGVKGMKRGEHKKEAKGIVKSLNKLDEQRAKATARYMKTEYKEDALNDKMDKKYGERRVGPATIRTNNGTTLTQKQINKKTKLSNKLDNASKKREIAGKKLMDIESKQQKLIAKAGKQKYNLISKDLIRDGRSATEKILTFGLGGVVGNTAMNVHYVNKYKNKYPTKINNIYGKEMKINQNPMYVRGMRYKINGYTK